MNAIDRYRDRLSNPVLPGGGCHGWILSTANYGAMAGISPDQLVTDIRAAITGGTRRVPDHEILVTVKKAMHDRGKPFASTAPGGYARPNPIVADGSAALKKIISMGKFSSETDLITASPVRLSGDMTADRILFLKTLFLPNDMLWIGERTWPGIPGKTIHSAKEWVAYFRGGGKTAPFIIINPLSGLPAPKKSGEGVTYRGDGNVLSYRYCLVEFDGIPREDQIRFWSAAKLPIRALIDSGGNRFTHGWTFRNYRLSVPQMNGR